MNLDAMLPLLMKDADPKTAAMLSALTGGDKSKMLEGLMGKDEKSKELFKMMSLMQGVGGGNQKKVLGLKAIHKFAPADILGILVKYYS